MAWSQSGNIRGASGIPGASGASGASGLQGASGASGPAVDVATVSASEKTTPVDADLLPLVDSAASNVLKKLTWSSLKATLKTYFDDLSTTLSSKTLASPAITGTAKVAQSGVLEMYNTSDQVTNYERHATSWLSNRLEIANLYGGTGSARTLRLGVSAASGGTGASRYIDIQSAAPFVNLTNGGSGSGGTLNAVMNGASATASSGTQHIFGITPTINQSSTASYTALLVNPTETATGSGAKRLIDAQVGGTTKFNVDNAGNVSATGRIGIASGNAPAAANSTGTAGQIAWDTSYLYVCTATDTWKRVAIATW